MVVRDGGLLLCDGRLGVARCERTFAPRPDTVQRRLEHMFVRVGTPSDGTGGPASPGDARDAPEPPGPPTTRYTVGPREDQTSNLAAIRLTTSVVNSMVPACPPRSGVFVPEAIVSNADS